MKKLIIILALLSIGCSKQEAEPNCDCGIVSDKEIIYTTMQVPGGPPIQIKVGWEYTIFFKGCNPNKITYQTTEDNFDLIKRGDTKCI